ncbi:MAG TPA: quinone oxidoreductase [Polyangiaceae bacterium]
MHHAIRVHRAGGPEEMRFERVTRPTPGPAQALVRHTAIGVNFIDVYHRSGVYKQPELPFGLGTEAAGVVEAIGSEVNEVHIGQRVAYVHSKPGAYAETAVMDAARLVPLPEDVSDEAAAALLLKGMTVEFLIRRTYPLRAGHTVLWHAAAGGVGTIACQWLRSLGVEVIATVGSDEKAQLAKQHGATHTIVYTRENFAERVRELTAGGGVPVVYDSVGKDTFQGSLEALSPRGLMVTFGNASGKPDPVDPQVLAAKGSLYLTRPTLFSYISTRAELLDSANALFSVMRAGVVKLSSGGRWPLDEAADAHRALEARKTTGSLLLIP